MLEIVFNDYWWIILVLLAQLVWAAGNFIDGYLLRRYRLEDSESAVGTLLIISSLFGFVVALAVTMVAWVLPYVGYTGDTTIFLGDQWWWIALVVGFLEVAWLLPYYYALDDSNEVQVVPLFQFVPVIGVIFGLTIFHESIALIHLAGIITILLGAILLNRDSFSKQINFRTIYLMTVTSMLITIAAFLFKEVANATNFWAATVWMSFGMGLTGIVVMATMPVYRSQFQRFLAKKDRGGIIINAANEVVDNAALILFNAAIVVGPSVPAVQAMIAYQPIFTLCISWVLGLSFISAYYTSHRPRASATHTLYTAGAVIIIVLGSIMLFI